MGALSSYGRAWSLLVEHPLLLLFPLVLVALRIPAFASSTFGVGQSFSLQALQIIYSFLLWFAVPLVAGATLGGVFRASREEELALDSLWKDAKGNYLAILLGTVLMIIITVGLLLAVVLGALALYALSTLPDLGTTFSLSAVLIFSLLALVAVLVIMVMLQFYDSAIVIDSRNPVDAFKTSFTFSRSRIPPVIGVSILKALTYIVLAIPTAIIVLYYFFTSIPFMQLESGLSLELPSPSFPLAFGAMLAQIIFGTLSMCFLYVYEAVYYTKERRKDV